MSENEKKYSFEDFREIIRILRSEQGCPWDRAQTHESLRSCMIEEAYEAVSAVNKGDKENLCEELGDVLLQVMLHSQIAKEEGSFTLDDVIQGISEKMIRRHPHVFGDGDRSNVLGWEEIKRQEHAGSRPEGLFQGIPEEFPALIRAQKILKRAQQEYPSLQDPVWDAGQIGIRSAMLTDRMSQKPESSKEGEELAFEEEQILSILLHCVNILRLRGVHAEQLVSDCLEKISGEGQNTAKILDKYL